MELFTAVDNIVGYITPESTMHIVYDWISTIQCLFLTHMLSVFPSGCCFYTVGWTAAQWHRSGWNSGGTQRQIQKTCLWRGVGCGRDLGMFWRILSCIVICAITRKKCLIFCLMWYLVDVEDILLGSNEYSVRVIRLV